MTQLQLIQHLSSFDTFKVIKFRSKLKEQSFTLNELVDLTFHSDDKIALKASKILQYILFRFPENYIDQISYLVENVGEVECRPCKKHYAKILAHLTSPGIQRDMRNQIKEINFEKVVELGFNWLRDPKMLATVRAGAAETLFNLRHRYPWIAEALSRDLEALLPKASPLLAVKANFILSFLHCED